MIDNPEIARQLVNGRREELRHDAATRRLVRLTRRRTRGRHRIVWTAWFDGRRRTVCAPEPVTA